MTDPVDIQFAFDRCLYDYMLRKNMKAAAENFLKEIESPFNPATTPPVADEFLGDWWRLFYDLFKSRQSSVSEQGECSREQEESSIGLMPLPESLCLGEALEQSDDPPLPMLPPLNEILGKALQQSDPPLPMPTPMNEVLRKALQHSDPPLPMLTPMNEILRKALQHSDPPLPMPTPMNEKILPFYQNHYELDIRNSVMDLKDPPMGVEFVLEGISTTTHPQEFLTIIGQNFGKSPDQQVGLTVPEAAADEELVSNE